MAEKQGSLALLNDPIAQRLLGSRFMAHLAYNWTDGTPRVVPIWFDWNGEEFIFCSVANSFKAKALVNGVPVAITVDSDTFPYESLLARGIVQTTLYGGVVPGYRETAARYIGDQMADMFVGAINSTGVPMKRIAVKPTWVGLIDFQTRMPSTTS